MTTDSPPQSAQRVSAFAPAKINLFLHVTGRRPDGYHELDSLIAFAEIGDRIQVRAADHLSLHIEGPFSEFLSDDDDNNLVMQAARLLAAEGGIPDAAAITLTKSLPVASGIGGGSADAAATLQALNNLWNCGLDGAELARLGLTLGADVPVCLFGAVARVRGIGDRIEAVPELPEMGLVLVNPGVPVSTAGVFADRDGGFSGDAGIIGPWSDVDALVGTLKRVGNDLEASARSIAPVIDDVLNSLRGSEDCLLARLSGSGATCFGLYPDRAEAAQAAGQIKLLHPKWWVQDTVLSG